MIKEVKYWIVYVAVLLPALLPLRILYFVSDILYPIVYYVARYRRKVVRMNLTNSFPEKSLDEIIRIEKKFYHHFCDFMMESIKQAHFPKDEVLKRTVLKNPEFLDKWHKNGRSIVLMTGHYANWEWFASLNFRIAPIKLAGIYKQLRSPEMDRFFLKLRSSYDAIPIEKERAVRELIRLKKQNIQIMIAFVSDQTPDMYNLIYWTNFLNQDSSIYVGGERIAKMIDFDVVYLEMEKVGRGMYTAEFKLIADNPKETAEFEITEKYARMMEATIIKAPEYWLWTHKRWKHKRKKS